MESGVVKTRGKRWIDPRDELSWRELYDVARHSVNNNICVFSR